MATRAAKLALRGKALTDTGTEIGIVNNADATAITIDASENVGIGTTSPITKLDASQDNIGGNVAFGIFQSGNAYGNVASSASLYLGATYHSLANSAKITSTHSSGTTGDHAQDLTFNPINSGSTSFEAMRIDSAGNVGIGVTPEAWNTNFTAARLGTRTVLANTTAGNGETTILANNFLNDGSAEQHIQTGPASIYQQYNGTHSFTVIPSAAAGAAASLTTAMTIDNSTKIGINQAPAAHWQMYIKSTIDGNGVLQLERSTNADSTFRSHVLFSRGGSTVGEIKTNHNSTQYNTTSDYRLKENVTPMSGATAQIKLLKPCNFDWKTVGGNVNGFLAHELAEVVPEAVSGTKDAMMDEEYEVTAATDTEAAVMGTRSVPDLQGIDQSKLVPLLTATIQELIARIEALENN
jgi:hypothetical protein